MSTTWLTVVKLFLSVAILIASIDQASAENSLQYTSEPGDVVGGGMSGRYTDANANFVFTHYPGEKERIVLQVNPKDGSSGWDITMAAPPGERLTPGRYPDVMGYPHEGRVGTLVVDRRPPSPCFGGETYVITGSFSIRQIMRDADGKIVSLEADFFQRCDVSSDHLLSGVLRYNAMPLSLAIAGELRKSSSDDSIKVNDRFYNDLSVFNLFEGTSPNTPNGVSIYVSGKKQGWQLGIFPTNKLEVGNYKNIFGVGVQTGYFELYECWSANGPPESTLSVKKVQRDTAGKLIGLYATFEIPQCTPGGGPVTGTIHYLQ
jgi:hypothetical protein